MGFQKNPLFILRTHTRCSSLECCMLLSFIVLNRCGLGVWGKWQVGWVVRCVVYSYRQHTRNTLFTPRNICPYVKKTSPFFAKNVNQKRFYHISGFLGNVNILDLRTPDRKHPFSIPTNIRFRDEFFCFFFDFFLWINAFFLIFFWADTSSNISACLLQNFTMYSQNSPFLSQLFYKKTLGFLTFKTCFSSTLRHTSVIFF